MDELIDGEYFLIQWSESECFMRTRVLYVLFFRGRFSDIQAASNVDLFSAFCFHQDIAWNIVGPFLNRPRFTPHEYVPSIEPRALDSVPALWRRTTTLGS
jgi:hypothetical protein